ncbi:MAG: DUF1622 domain-containing protein [Clostridia bacterium]|nr:DUF1622 domain-containing protein [Clostridia bacterium]
MNLLVSGLEKASEASRGIDRVLLVSVNALSYIFTLIGILVLSIAVFKAFAAYWRRVPNMRIQLALARGMQLSLQFLLGGEILQTIIAENWNGILVVGAIIALRFALNFTIHWETNCLCHEQSDLDGPPNAKREKEGPGV